MKVSIITVSYNSEKTIRATIESVLSQDFNDIEYIIIDGASKDSTLSIVNEYIDKIAKVISEADKGIYDAMNKGINLATGDVIGIINSDDFYPRNDVISRVVNGFTSFPDIKLFLGAVDFVSESNLDRVVRRYSSKGFSPWLMRCGIMPPHPATFISKKAYEEFGLYELGYKIGADFELLLRFLMVKKLKYLIVDEVLVRMRLGGVSTSGVSSYWIITREILKSLKDNRVYSNVTIVMLRVVLKFRQFICKAV